MSEEASSPIKGTLQDKVASRQNDNSTITTSINFQGSENLVSRHRPRNVVPKTIEDVDTSASPEENEAKEFSGSSDVDTSISIEQPHNHLEHSAGTASPQKPGITALKSSTDDKWTMKQIVEEVLAINTVRTSISIDFGSPPHFSPINLPELNPSSPEFRRAFYDIIRPMPFEFGEGASGPGTVALVARCDAFEQRKRDLCVRSNDAGYPPQESADSDPLVKEFAAVYVNDGFLLRETLSQLETLERRRRRLIQYIDDEDKTIHPFARNTTLQPSEKGEELDAVIKNYDFTGLLNDLRNNHLERIELLRSEHILKLDLSDFLKSYGREELLPSTVDTDYGKNNVQRILQGERIAPRFRVGDEVTVMVAEPNEETSYSEENFRQGWGSREVSDTVAEPNEENSYPMKESSRGWGSRYCAIL